MCKFCRNWQICTFFISTRRSIKHACYYRFGQGYHHHSRQLFKKIKEENPNVFNGEQNGKIRIIFHTPENVDPSFTFEKLRLRDMEILFADV